MWVIIPVPTKIMKHFYYMVPKCPKCGSFRTGRYVKRPLRNSDYMMVESLKNGEIIEFKEKEPVKNAFCLDCGYTWPQRVVAQRLTEEEIEDEVVKRKTAPMLKEYIESHGLDKKKKSIFGGIFSGFTNF